MNKRKWINSKEILLDKNILIGLGRLNHKIGEYQINFNKKIIINYLKIKFNHKFIIKQFSLSNNNN